MNPLKRILISSVVRSARAFSPRWNEWTPASAFEIIFNLSLFRFLETCPLCSLIKSTFDLQTPDRWFWGDQKSLMKVPAGIHLLLVRLVFLVELLLELLPGVRVVGVGQGGHHQHRQQQHLHLLLLCLNYWLQRCYLVTFLYWALHWGISLALAKFVRVRTLFQMCIDMYGLCFALLLRSKFWGDINRKFCRYLCLLVTSSVFSFVSNSVVKHFFVLSLQSGQQAAAKWNMHWQSFRIF